MHPLAQPFERIGFELHQGGSGRPDTRVAVGGVGDEVGQRRRIDAAPGDIREIARSRSGEGARDELVDEEIEQRLEGAAALGRGLAQGATEFRRVDVAAARRLGDGRNVLYGARDDLLAH